MKKPNITQGEWTIEQHDHVDGEVWLSLNQGAIDVTHNVRGDQIASQKFSITDPKERQANAKAISAVPEMIDALIAINESEEARKAMGSIARSKMIKALKKAGLEL